MSGFAARAVMLVALTVVAVSSCASGGGRPRPADVNVGDAVVDVRETCSAADVRGPEERGSVDASQAEIATGGEASPRPDHSETVEQHEESAPGDGGGIDAAEAWVQAPDGGTTEVMPPGECMCPSELPVCYAHTVGDVKKVWCTSTCDPADDAGVVSCEGLLGMGACCKEGYSAGGKLDHYCFPADACCVPCGSLCCPPGTSCEGTGEACVPLGAQYCGGDLWCTAGMVCVGATCCPVGSTVVCGGGCCPDNYLCVEDAGVCMPPQADYCGGENYCPPGTDCYDQAGTVTCIPVGYTQCDSGHWCAPGQVCAGKECCPALLPIACGELCCGEHELCIGDGEACVPEDTDYCGDGVYCPIGYHCAPDSPMCVPDTADYCGAGVWCKPGQVCAGSGCCPQGLPQSCGSLCCLGSYQCTPDKLACIPPGADYCGAGKWCPPGDLCAEGGDVCYPVGGEYCGEGHWCDPGLHCAGNTCCGYADPPSCGVLCCPSGYECIKGGEACIPPGADYCGNGKWCNPGMLCKDGGGCMLLGAEDCGLGVSCGPGTTCVVLSAGPACCPENNSIGCLDKCCPTNYGCGSDGEDGVCIPPGATYCGNGIMCFAGYSCAPDGTCMPPGSVQCAAGAWCMPNFVCKVGGGCCPISAPDTCGDICCAAGSICVDDAKANLCLPPGAHYCGDGSWCPSDMKCPKYGDKCVPLSSEECSWGGICAVDQVCAIGAAKCCPKGSPLACESICCPSGTTCKQLSDGPFCLSPGASVCPGTELVCQPATKCSPDGTVCMPLGASYCGNGMWCEAPTVCSWDGTSCGSSQAEYCGDGLWCGPGAVCTPDDSDCMPLGSDYCGDQIWCPPGMECTANKECAPPGLTTCGDGFCLPGTALQGGNLQYCPADNPVRCLTGCCPPGTVCRPVPTQDPPYGPLSPTETCLSWPEYHSPNLSADGSYIIDNDSDNCGEPHQGIGKWEKVSDGSVGDEFLVVEAAWVLDNLETDACELFDPHGPFGRLVFDVASGKLLDQADEVCGCGGGQVCLPLLGGCANCGGGLTCGYKERSLRGPHRGPPCACWCIGILMPDWLGGCWGHTECAPSPEDEWWDYEFMRYQYGRAGIHKWAPGEVGVTVVVEESDFENTDDVGGVEYVKKSDTELPYGLWVPFFKYEAISWCLICSPYDNCLSKQFVSAYLLLRTVKCTGNPGDPC